MEWKFSYSPIIYDEAKLLMEERVSEIISGKESELVWLLEHDEVYTCGVSGNDSDLLEKNLKLISTNRGGKITYHGPGIRIIYLMLDLNKRKSCDVRKYVQNLEHLIINILSRFGIKGEERKNRIGIWVRNEADFFPSKDEVYSSKEDKIASIGVRLKKWITYHGIAVNLYPNLEKFKAIIPCGIEEKIYGVTSLKKLGISVSYLEFDKIFQEEFEKIFAL